VKPLLDSEHIKYVETYPQRYEEDRGELSLFGHGEGPTSRAADCDSTYHRMQIPDDASVDDHPSPPAETKWGAIGDLASSDVYPADLGAKSRSKGELDFDQAKSRLTLTRTRNTYRICTS
jgi:hypothetical protein